MSSWRSLWTDSRRADYKNTASAVRQAVVTGLKEAGIGLPEPDVRLLRPQDIGSWNEALSGRGAQLPTSASRVAR